MRIVVIIRSDKTARVVRNFSLHTSAAGFAADLLHALIGKLMIFADVFERIREPVVAYSAFAATLVVYFDGRREKLHRKAREKESTSTEDRVG